MKRGVCVVLVAAGSAFGQASVWNFEGNLGATLGPGVMTARAGQTSAFGTASGFGLPLFSDGDSGVIRVDPIANAGSGFDVRHFTNANGGGSYGNQYTLMYDILTPTIGWTSFYNTNEANANDGDAFINPAGGIGISGVYDGALTANTWNRVAFTVDLSGSPTMKKYINGSLVGTQTLGDGLDGRWALYTESNGPAEPTWFILMGDNDGDTTLTYLSSFYFADRVLSDNEVGALGGASARGIPAPGAIGLLAAGVLAGLRRRR